MNKKLNVFFERLIDDYRFREQFMSTRTAKEGYELALPYLDSVSFEEFQEGLTSAYSNVRANGKKPLSTEKHNAKKPLSTEKYNAKKPLTREEYNKVSGGVACWNEVINVINSVII